MRRAALLLLAVPLAACGDDAGGGPDGGTCPADVRTQSQVYYGTEQPTYAPLTPGQVLAVGAWTGSSSGGEIFCSGTLIAPSWALTADHCGIATGDWFCLGASAADPVGCLRAAEVQTRPTVTVAGGGTTQLDLTVVRLDGDATTLGAEPIPIAVDPLTGYLSQMAETAGFGETHTGTSGDRLFALETIDDVGGEDPAFLTVNGMGQRGVCFGDSGGPVLVIDGSGAARVAGALSWGDPSCVDRDRYARVDLALTWIEQYTGPTPVPEGGPCGALDEVGRCSGDRALWCQAGVVAGEACADGETCGWDAAAGGFRCITGADPCAGVDRTGGCDGAIARWCDDGVPRARDCACLGQLCTVEGALGGAYCADDPCMGIDFLGECQGEVAVWCDGGALQTQDCGANGQTCGFVNDSVGYYCQ